MSVHLGAHCGGLEAQTETFAQINYSPSSLDIHRPSM